MTPAPLQVGAGALGVGAEQRRLHAVGLGERLADRVEQSGVGRRVAPPRAADRALVDRHHAVPPRHRAVDQRALARPGHAGDHHQHAERDVDVDVLQVVRARAAHLQRARRCPHRRLRGGPVVQVPPGERAARPQSVDGALEHDLAAAQCRRPGRGRRRGRRSRSLSGLCSTTSTVLPLSRSCSSRSFIRWMSCGCSPIVGSSKT